jgi:hypothetical protein
MDSFASAVKNQSSFTKMLETQLAQLAATVPFFEQGKIPGKPEDPVKTANLVTSTLWNILIYFRNRLILKYKY